MSDVPAVVAIIDYGMGNLASVAGAVAKVGHTPLVTHEESEIARADRIIIPGVGAFADAMSQLRARGLVAPLNDAALAKEIPLLGICLGAQLLCVKGEEFGVSEGLGWLPATVERLRPTDSALRIPHVGWNDLIKTRDSVLFQDLTDDPLFYYVHSYCLVCDDRDVVIGECDYGGRFAAALQLGNIYATQFHPEKSQRDGLALLRNFIERT